MPYDDPILRELGGYFKAEEPGRRERADAWATAIGLQKVDGLTPSQFLFDTAKDHIEGRITQNQARRRIHDYYAKGSTAGAGRPPCRRGHAGRVTLPEAVSSKPPYQNAKADPGMEEADKLSERIVAVLNDAFRDNSWYFRNALVRANYADYAREVSRDWSYLEIFFRNLLLGEKNEMKSRYLLIGLTAEDKQKIRELTEEKGDGKKKVAHKSGPSREKNRPRGREESREKKPSQSREKILVLLAAKPTLTYAGLAEAIGLTVKAIEKNVRQLKAAGRLRRVGPDKGGHWEVVT